ncbi:TlpA family protein disulfide reductase [Tenacibaculum amylolyticum]|uniref:TlpA family protein disulfide reductase n=1 Tax=Tenacibaculum amylolyticum TaxID=104269 RepID=UPI003892D1E0
MKNFLITIVTIAVAFSITFYVLTNFYKHENELEDLSASTNTELYSNSNESDDTNTSTDDSDSTTDSATVNSDLLPDVDSILGDLQQWESYFNEDINLSSDFIPLDMNGEEIEKDAFLKELTTGDYVPVKLASGDVMYQLYELGGDEDESISDAIKDAGTVAYDYFLKEGTPLPEFNVVDLNGTTFTTDNTREKILILECWYVDSKPCIQEFPELNELYDKYEAYEDVVFLSFAFDNAGKLRKFLTKNEFRYPVVADQKSYLEDQLEVKQYPTHLIVDEYGNIEKMVTSVAQLKEALAKIAEPDLTQFDDQEGM